MGCSLHSHLVSSIGYCNNCNEVILVCEYMICGTLTDRLFKIGRNVNNNDCTLSSVRRLKICVGAARPWVGLPSHHECWHPAQSHTSRCEEISDFGYLNLDYFHVSYIRKQGSSHCTVHCLKCRAFEVLFEVKCRRTL